MISVGDKVLSLSPLLTTITYGLFIYNASFIDLKLEPIFVENSINKTKFIPVKEAL